MLRLLLLRHAKSSWGQDNLTDMDRPLAPRGVEAAARIGERMRDEGLFPDFILCSGASRARQTLLGILPAILPSMPAHAEIALSAGLYGAADGDYLGMISGQEKDARMLLVIGHNPAMQATATRLAGKGDPEKLHDLGQKFPTAALAVIDFEADDWTGIAPGAGQLVDFIRAK